MRVRNKDRFQRSFACAGFACSGTHTACYRLIFNGEEILEIPEIMEICFLSYFEGDSVKSSSYFEILENKSFFIPIGSRFEILDL